MSWLLCYATFRVKCELESAEILVTRVDDIHYSLIVEASLQSWTECLRLLHGDAARYRCKDRLPGTGLARRSTRKLGPSMQSIPSTFALEQGFR